MPTVYRREQHGTNYGMPTGWWTVYRNDQPIHHWPVVGDADRHVTDLRAARTPEELEDWELIAWATKNAGWVYYHNIDQLQSPQGGLTSTNNRKDIGEHRRKQIVELMKKAKQ